MAARLTTSYARPPRRHPDLRVVLARTETFGRAMRAGFSQADARDMAEAEARRVRRELDR